MKAILKNNLAIIEMVLLLLIIGMVIFILNEVELINAGDNASDVISIKTKRYLAISGSQLLGDFNINQICG